MTEIERLTKIRETLEEARRYVGQDAFIGLAVESMCLLNQCDSACAGGLCEVLAQAIYMRQADPGATRGAIDYARGWLAWTIGRLERDEQNRNEKTHFV